MLDFFAEIRSALQTGQGTPIFSSNITSTTSFQLHKTESTTYDSKRDYLKNEIKTIWLLRLLFIGFKEFSCVKTNFLFIYGQEL